MFPTAPLEKRQELFKFQSASCLFGHAESICEILIDQKITNGHPLHLPLMTALHVVYSKPFKQTKSPRLEESIVPEKHKSIHDALIMMRDKIHAHTDLNGPKTSENHLLNKVVIFARQGVGARFALPLLVPRELRLNEIRDLARELCEITLQRAEQILGERFHKFILPEGDYEVNISDDSDEILKPLKWQ